MYVVAVWWHSALDPVYMHVCTPVVNSMQSWNPNKKQHRQEEVHVCVHAADGECERTHEPKEPALRKKPELLS